MLTTKKRSASSPSSSKVTQKTTKTQPQLTQTAVKKKVDQIFLNTARSKSKKIPSKECPTKTPDIKLSKNHVNMLLKLIKAVDLLYKSDEKKGGQRGGGFCSGMQCPTKKQMLEFIVIGIFLVVLTVIFAQYGVQTITTTSAGGWFTVAETSTTAVCQRGVMGAGCRAFQLAPSELGCLTTRCLEAVREAARLEGLQEGHRMAMESVQVGGDLALKAMTMAYNFSKWVGIAGAITFIVYVLNKISTTVRSCFTRQSGGEKRRSARSRPRPATLQTRCSAKTNNGKRCKRLVVNSKGKRTRCFQH